MRQPFFRRGGVGWGTLMKIFTFKKKEKEKKKEICYFTN
jgi:hypothetical protein